jgi:hypothetical protein
MFIPGHRAAKSLYEVAVYIDQGSLPKNIKHILIKQLKSHAETLVVYGEAQIEYEAWIAKVLVDLFTVGRN